MAPIPEPDLTATGGTYDVNEAGIEFRHAPALTTPKDGTEFLTRMQNNLSLKVLDRPSKNELVFELVGVDISFANALRRIMIAEVPTMALEFVYMWNNSGLIHDEVLSHRLGLVPLNVDPRLFDEYGFDVDEDGNPAATDRNTIVFRLNVTCGRTAKEDEKIRKKMEVKWKNEGLVSGYDVAEAQKSKKEKKKSSSRGRGGKTNDDEMEDNLEPSVMNLSIADRAAADAVSSPNVQPTPIDSPHRPFTKHVYTRDFLWAPQGDQLSRFPLHSSGVGSGVGGGIRPLHEDILIAKLRPGQVIELEAHARKGVGKDHAKFSPVATASYRLMPHVEILKPVYDELAEELVNWFEPGVFKCEPTDEDGHRIKAVVVNPYACTMSRNYMRNPILKESIKMSRIPNHFIFSVESVGMMEPAVIVAEALKVLKEKCERVSGLADDALAMGE
eukprot:CAMPEP_0196143456 /NCGR_PEP_ID=MMETSP0910-20130528/13408_1 /TAXON_ID=49265 /ORGANISM="Thalassiosira rotula, Strain GSO102" /LENGTH=443 /DNA_ID=CAMNT_0041404919 /DNA_START=89 /DNA_END=1420 /DNA_ORIENTATION=+